jgi:hypothetical protein
MTKQVDAQTLANWIRIAAQCRNNRQLQQDAALDGIKCYAALVLAAQRAQAMGYEPELAAWDAARALLR